MENNPYTRGMKTLVEVNRQQQEQASQRWRLILDLSKTKTSKEIGAMMGLTRQRVEQLIEKAKAYFGHDGQQGGS